MKKMKKKKIIILLGSALLGSGLSLHKTTPVFAGKDKPPVLTAGGSVELVTEDDDYGIYLYCFQEKYQKKYQQIQEQIKKLQQEFNSVSSDQSLSPEVRNKADQLNKKLSRMIRQVLPVTAFKDRIDETGDQFTCYDNAYLKGRTIIWLNQMQIATHHAYLNELLTKLRINSAGNQDLQQKMTDFLNQLTKSTVTVDNNEQDLSSYSEYLDPDQVSSLTPAKVDSVQLWRYATEQRNEMEQLLRNGKLDRGLIKESNYALFGNQLAREYNSWFGNLPRRGEKLTNFWFDDTDHQLWLNARPVAPTKRPLKKTKVSKTVATEKVVADDFAQQKRIFLARLENRFRGPQLGYRDLSYSNYIFNDFMKDQYLILRREVTQDRKPLSWLPLFDHCVDLADGSEKFAWYYSRAEESFDGMGGAVKRLLVGKLGQVAIDNKKKKLEAENRPFFQARLDDLKAEATEIQNLKAEFTQFQKEFKQQSTQQLTDNLAALADFASYFDSDNLELALATKTIAELNEIKAQSEQQQKQVSTDLLTKIDENKQQQQINEQLRKKQQTLQEPIKIARSSLEEATKNQEEIKGELQQLTAQLDQASGKIATLADQKAILAEQSAKLESESTLADEQIDQQKSAIAELSEKLARLAPLAPTKLSDDPNTSLLEKSVAEATARATEIKRLTQELNQLEEKISQGETESDQSLLQSGQLIDQIQELKLQISDLEAESTALSLKIRTLSSQVARLRPRWKKAIEELNQLEQEVTRVQNQLDQISGCDHFSTSKISLDDNYCRLENLSNETIRLILRGSLMLRTSIILDCHGLYVTDMADFLERVLQAMAQIDFSSRNNKSLVIMFMTGYGAHNSDHQAHLKMELERLLDDYPGYPIAYRDVPNNPGMLAVTFDQRFIKDNLKGFKIPRYKEVRARFGWVKKS